MRVSFYEKNGQEILSIDDHGDVHLKKGDEISLSVRKKREQTLITRIWIVEKINRGFHEEEFNTTPSQEWPFPTKNREDSYVEIRVRPKRHYCFGIRKDGGKFFSKELDGRFFRIWKFYIGLGYYLN